MACFTVSLVEAAAVAALKKHAEHSEKKHKEGEHGDRVTIPMSKKLGRLSRMLLGGSILLAFEHVWHGEIVPRFPFLTAMNDPADTAEMLHEIATVGVCMACLVTAVWGIMCLVEDAAAKREAKDAKDVE